MDLTIVDIPDRRAAAVLHVGPFDGIGAAFDRLRDWMLAHAGAVAGPPLALYLDDPRTTAPEALRSYAAVPVTEDLPADPTGVVEQIDLPGGRYAVGAHRGSYAGLGATWQDFMASVPADGLRPDEGRAPFEVYVSEPGTVPDDELITELHQPIS